MSRVERRANQLAAETIAAAHHLGAVVRLSEGSGRGHVRDQSAHRRHSDVAGVATRPRSQRAHAGQVASLTPSRPGPSPSPGPAVGPGLGPTHPRSERCAHHAGRLPMTFRLSAPDPDTQLLGSGAASGPVPGPTSGTRPCDRRSHGPANRPPRRPHPPGGTRFRGPPAAAATDWHHRAARRSSGDPSDRGLVRAVPRPPLGARAARLHRWRRRPRSSRSHPTR